MSLVTPSHPSEAARARPVRPGGRPRMPAVMRVAVCAGWLAVATAVPTRPAAAQSVDLEGLSERATQAVVLIDVRTASDSRQGSGFLVGSDGLILTNHHVVRDARSARVKLASGDVYDRVSILARDERRDIAVLQIAGFDLPTLPLGNSDSVRIGAPVVLIGSPLGLENTVSTGIVSGRRQEPEGFQLIQVTAPASRGSSGGAVLGADGSVVGIAASQFLAGQNLNFAVPINYARGLLQNLGPEPLEVLEPTTAVAAEPAARPMASESGVNGGLRFDVDSFPGYVAEYEVALGEDVHRRTRVTYRVIESVGGGPARVERYLQSETTRRTEPFGTPQTVRRERVRSLMGVAGLRPISSRGEVSWWQGEGWRTASHDVRFEGDRVVGMTSDTTGRSLDLDRVLPQGVILREARDLAFATLAVDSLVGRSVEFSVFDAWTGEVVEDRYDVLAAERLDVLGASRDVLRVNAATGLDNETIYFLESRPRVPLRRVGQEGDETEMAVRIDGVEALTRRPGRPPG